MSNERIDLTQFEEITEGTWEVTEPDWPHYGVMYIAPCSATVRRYQNDRRSEESWYANAKAIAAVPDLISELKKCYEREDRIIDALKGVWIGDTCWHQPSEHLEDIAETRGSKLGYIASLLQVDVNQQDIHELEYGCGGENCDHNASE